MMKRPEPKSEIIIVEHPNVIKITVASEDAQAWVEREAPTFGCLTFVNRIALLIVKDTYDPSEVADYLRTYNQ